MPTVFDFIEKLELSKDELRGMVLGSCLTAAVGLFYVASHPNFLTQPPAPAIDNTNNNNGNVNAISTNNSSNNNNVSCPDTSPLVREIMLCNQKLITVSSQGSCGSLKNELQTCKADLADEKVDRATPEELEKLRKKWN